MTKKIVAVGGGENGRLKSDGTRTMYPYELEKMDKEIIKLTKKEHPNFLLIAHSQPLENQQLAPADIPHITFPFFQAFLNTLSKPVSFHNLIILKVSPPPSYMISAQSINSSTLFLSLSSLLFKSLQ